MLTHTILNTMPVVYFERRDKTTGADPGFLKGVQIYQEGVLFSTFYLIFQNFPNEIEIFWSQGAP